MKASRETARTSRAAAPSAAPAAAEAAPPSTIAASQRAKRPHSSGTKIVSPASIRIVTTRPTATPSRTFSPSSASLETSPRASRG